MLIETSLLELTDTMLLLDHSVTLAQPNLTQGSIRTNKERDIIGNNKADLQRILD